MEVWWGNVAYLQAVNTSYIFSFLPNLESLDVDMSDMFFSTRNLVTITYAPKVDGGL